MAVLFSGASKTNEGEEEDYLTGWLDWNFLCK